MTAFDDHRFALHHGCSIGIGHPHSMLLDGKLKLLNRSAPLRVSFKESPGTQLSNPIL